MVLPEYSIILRKNKKEKKDDGRVHIYSTRRILNTPSILLFLLSISFWNASKYCLIFKNKNH